MSSPEARSVDPRYATQVVDKPVYRVDFWSRDGASDEWLHEDAASFHDVLTWATAHAHDRDIVIYVQADSRSSAILRLHGQEPGAR
jgi:hypothetical protein